MGTSLLPGSPRGCPGDRCTRPGGMPLASDAERTRPQFCRQEPSEVSAGLGATNYLADRTHQNDDVAPERPVLDVVVVEAGALLD